MSTEMFTEFFLQEKLKKELEEMFKEDRFPGKDGKMTGLSVYGQFLPITDAAQMEVSQEELENRLPDESVEEIPVPYIQVILPDGKVNTANKPGMTNILLYLCVYDNGKEREGYQYLLNMIHRICERFQKNSAMGTYRCGEEILWELSEEDDHPYYFGAVAMEFQIQTIEKEDRYC